MQSDLTHSGQPTWRAARHRIQFPPASEHELEQNESYFYLVEDGGRRRIRMHDYDELYRIPGLYEQVVYDRLKCQSPELVREVLEAGVTQAGGRVTELRVLDLGAGNGMMGEELKRNGLARLVGVDIIPEAREAAHRDRPGTYDAYHVVDFCELGDDERAELQGWSLNCLVTVAALGFGDIPPKAFMQAFRLIDDHGWVAFNIKDKFFSDEDETGFSQLIRQLVFSDSIELYQVRRYRHRYSLDGEPLFYYAICGRKNNPVPEQIARAFEQAS